MNEVSKAKDVGVVWDFRSAVAGLHLNLPETGG
jgi:hypothetical protein